MAGNNTLTETAERPKVLIVDDDKINIDILVGLLKAKYRTIIAMNGDQALKRLSTQSPPDLILLDIIMPGMDGYEVCKKIKSNPDTKDIPIIFLTAKSTTEDTVIGFRAGAVDFITKPFKPEELLIRINTHIQLRRAVVDLENALKEIKTLRGILPICCNCKKIRDDKGYWRQLEEYIHAHSEAEFSHSLCQTCVQELYPELDLNREDNAK